MGTFVPSPENQIQPTGIARRHFVPQGGKLVFTQWVIGVVVFIGPDTKLSLHGGKEAALAAGAARRQQEDAQKARAEEVRKARLPQPVPVQLIEEETGFPWETTFTDVPDDGNCMVHAFWLGLKTLLDLHPNLHISDAPVLPSTPIECRQQIAGLLVKDALYMEQLRTQFEFWVQELDLTILLGHIEDFFVMPEEFQQTITEANQLWRQGMKDVDYGSIVQQYCTAMASVREVNGRDTYIPLGEHELQAICRVYNCRLQVIKNDSLDPSVFPRPMDPRSIPPKLIHDINKESKRMVRLLNVNTNHYQLHLPQK